METSGLVSVFSGSDISCFIDGYPFDLMSIDISKNSTIATFILSEHISNIALNNGYYIIDLFGINEHGKRGLITINARPTDFRISHSIDELSIEIKVIFESNIVEIKGWFDGSDASNHYIGKKYHGFRGKV